MNPTSSLDPAPALSPQGISPIGELLRAEDVRLDVDAANRDELLAHAAALLARRSRLTEHSILQGLQSRERLGSTALGHGVALPHARVLGLPAPVAVFLRTLHAIPFNAPDGHLVESFLVLLVPAEASDRHLALMACAASQFADRSFRACLRVAPDAATVVELFACPPEFRASS